MRTPTLRHEQYIALEELSKALHKIVDLCENRNDGAWFNDKILAGKLGRCWGMSINEMAEEIDGVLDKWIIQVTTGKEGKA